MGVPPHPAGHSARTPAVGEDQGRRILVCDHRGMGLEGHLAPLTRSGLRLEFSRSLRDSRVELGRGLPALIVLDPLSAGGQVELEEVEHLRGGAAVPVPLLLVCDPGAPLPAVESVRLLGGDAWDLVHRDAPLEEFLLRIERLLGHARRLDELDELRYRASHDDRTELLRPRFFQARLVEHFSAAQRHGLELALLLIDLDEFGRINKLYDHTVGDRVIARAADAIRGTLRAEDVAGRLGGDEFGVLLPYSSALDSAHAAERLRLAIERVSERLSPRDKELRISASIGFETFDGRDLDSVATLRRHAEIALRAAKEAGGNRGVYYRTL